MGGDFPGGAVVESLPANAGDTGSSPGLGGSHMPWSDWAREPQLLSLRIWSLCSATREAKMVGGPHTAMRSGPRLLQLEKALTQKRRPNTAKNKKINKFIKKNKNLTVGTSQVAQWLRIHLPMQGTWVRALVPKDPTCHGATKPVHHNY